MISSEAIQVFEGDGINPRWKGFKNGDGFSVQFDQGKADHTDMDGSRDFVGNGSGNGNGNVSGNGFGSDGETDGDGEHIPYYENPGPGVQE